MSPDIQNELIQLMSSSMLESIALDIQSAKYFLIMADECVDVSNCEQLTICLRWVDDSLEVHECLYNLPDTTADTITAGIKDVLSEMKLQIQRCMRQCYDGASSMASSRLGVAHQILDEESRALFTHYYGHSLNLAMCDTLKNCKLARDALDTTNEISKLIKFSPKCNHMFG